MRRRWLLANALFVLVACRTKGEPEKPVSECVVHVGSACVDRRSVRPAYRMITARRLDTFTGPPAAKWVAEGIVDRELLAEEAPRLGITVSEDEVTDSLAKGVVYVSLPVDVEGERALGIEDGRMSLRELAGSQEAGVAPDADRAAKALGVTPAELRAWQTRELLAAKVRARVLADVTLPDDEAFEHFVPERTTAVVDYVYVRNAWVERHAIRVAGAAADAWAKEHPSELLVPVRDILVAAPPEGPADEQQKKAEDLLARARGGEDFAALARRYSDDPETKENGGELRGPDKIVDILPELIAVNKTLRPGEVAPEVVRTRSGYHVLERDAATHAANVASYAHARAPEVAEAMAGEILAAARSGKTLAQAADLVLRRHAIDAATDPLRPAVATTAPFLATAAPIPDLSPKETSQVVKLAMTAKPGDLATAPVHAYAGDVVLQLRERRAPTREQFAKEHDAYVAALLRTKRIVELRDHVRALRDAAKDTISIDTDRLMGARPDAGKSEG